MDADKQLSLIIDDIIAKGAPKSAISDDKYDNSLSEVLRRIVDEKNNTKIQWILMRVGLRTMINDGLARGRALLKAPLQEDYESEKKMLQRERNKENHENTKRKREYAQTHNISIDQVSHHKASAHFETAAREIKTYVERRAFEIMTSWVCDGGVKLIDCSQEDLLRLGKKEQNTAIGHTKTASFYFALAEHVPLGGRVGKMEPNDVVNCFNNAFDAKQNELVAA